MREIARTIRIDLVDLQFYSSISDPFVRLVMLLAVLLSATGLAGVLAPEINDLTIALAILITLLFVPTILLYIAPVWSLRNRIRDAKTEQLELISRSLKGDREAYARVLEIESSSDISKIELLTRQMFVESRWEWPIASHIQRLVLFGLLPPITWILAAIIENLLY